MKRIYTRPKNTSARDSSGRFPVRQIWVTNRDGHLDIDAAELRSSSSRVQIQLDGPDAREFAHAIALATTDEPPPSGEIAPNGRES